MSIEIDELKRKECKKGRGPLKSQSELSDNLRKALGPSHRHRTGVALILKEKLY